MGEHWVHILTLAEVIVMPLIVFLTQHIVLKRLNEFDAKREVARKENERRQNAMERGIRSLLRAELVRAHSKWMPRGYCPLETKEYVSRTYDAYHNMGGNDIGSAMYHDLMELPVNSE
jgi:hypothetical protein